MPPDNCVACDPECDSCQNITLTCEIKLNYQLKKPEIDNSGYPLSLDLVLTRQSGLPFNPSEILSETLMANVLDIEIVSPASVLSYDLYTTVINELALNISLPSNMETGKTYTIRSSNPGILVEKTMPDGSLRIFRLEGEEPQGIEYYHEEPVPESVVASAIATSESISSVTGVTSSTSDVLATFGILMSADQSGATLKFSQISKLISRLRYINVNFGSIFGSFLNGLGKSFDGKTSTSLDNDLKEADKEEIAKLIYDFKKKRTMIELYGNGNKGKFDLYNVDLFILGKAQKDWKETLINASTADEPSKRILVEGGDTETGMDFGVLVSELKYYIYIIFWMSKIVSYLILKKS